MSACATTEKMQQGISCEVGPSAEVSDDYIDLKLKGKRHFKPYWLVLAGSTLYYYKSEHQSEPKGSLELAKLRVAEKIDHAKAEGHDRFVFEVLDGIKTVFTVRTLSEDRARSWQSALGSARVLEPQSAPTKEAVEKQRRGIGYRAMKGMGSKLVGSSLGKSGINSVLDDQVKGMIHALKNLVEIDAGKAKADLVEAAVFKIVWKCFCEFERNTVTLKQFLEMDSPLRAALRRIDTLFNIWGWTPSDEQLSADFGAVSANFSNVGRILRAVMSSFLRPKNLMMIQELFDYIGSAHFLIHIWKIREEPVIKDAVFELMVAIRMYLAQDYQIHEGIQ